MSPRSKFTYVLLALAFAGGCPADPGVGGTSGAGGFGGVAANGGMGAIGGVGATGGVGAIGGVGATGGVGAIGGVGGISGTGGGGGLDAGAGGDGCVRIDDESPVSRGEVDIIWIIDNSCSMFDEYTRVKQNINAFAADINAAGVDHHVVAIVGLAVIPVISPAGDPAVGTALGMDPQRYLYVQEEIGSTNIMPKLISTFPRWSHMLRPNAPTHFVIVTDDRSEMPADQFRTTMEGLLGHGFIYHSIASEAPTCPGAANPGTEHYALSDLTGGEKISSCLMDWSPVFARLRDAVVMSLPLPCEFTIPAPPPGKEFDKEFVNFEYTPDQGTPNAWPRAQIEADCSTNIGWFYDNNDSPTTIKLCPAGCTAVGAGGKISIIFGCDPPPVLIPPG